MTAKQSKRKRKHGSSSPAQGRDESQLPCDLSPLHSLSSDMSGLSVCFQGYIYGDPEPGLQDRSIVQIPTGSACVCVLLLIVLEHPWVSAVGHGHTHMRALILTEEQKRELITEMLAVSKAWSCVAATDPETIPT